MTQFTQMHENHWCVLLLEPEKPVFIYLKNDNLDAQINEEGRVMLMCFKENTINEWV